MKKNKEWIVECPHGIYSIDGDVEKYLNSNPHPDYELFNVLYRRHPPIGIFFWKRKENRASGPIPL